MSDTPIIDAIEDQMLWVSRAGVMQVLRAALPWPGKRLPDGDHVRLCVLMRELYDSDGAPR